MGQYYKAYLKKDNEEIVLEPGGGMKLTEHSWIGNPLTDTVSHLLYKNKMQLAWVGDYAKDLADEAKRIPDEIYKKCWGKNAKESRMKNNIFEDFDYKGKFLINDTKKEYLSLDPKDCAEDSDGWYLYPVSLLTAVGNGLGGGDYRGINKDKVGIWKLDQLYIDDNAPKDYKKVEILFTEE